MDRSSVFGYVIAAVWISYSVRNVVVYGLHVAVPIFCIGAGGCYTSLPLSGIIFSCVIIYFSYLFGWRGAPLGILCGVLYDFFGSAVLQPFAEAWIIVIFWAFMVFFTWYISGYRVANANWLLVWLAGMCLFAVSPVRTWYDHSPISENWFLEPVFQVSFAFCFYRSANVPGVVDKRERMELISKRW